MEVFRIDRAPIGKLETRADGYLHGESVITRAGVFPYRGPSGETIYEFRPPTEVFNADSLETVKLVPLTIEHPASGRVTPENAQEVSVGTVGEAVRQDGQSVVAPIRITSRAGIDAVKGGKRQLSLGYHATVMRADGEFEGRPYTHIQTNIRYNHCALTEKARVGDIASVRLDAADAVQMIEDNASAPAAGAGGSRNMAGVQLRLDTGISYEVPAEVHAAWQQKETKVADLTTRLDSMTAERDAAVAERDKATGQRDEAKAELEKMQKTDHAEEIRSAVKARIALEGVARRALDEKTVEKLDSMSDQDLRVAVIQSRHKEFSADGKSSDYIAARFDAIAEGIEERNDQGVKIVGNIRTDSPCAEKSRERRIDEMRKRSRGEKVEA